MFNTYIFDGHGHSKASDGCDSVKQILHSALSKKINILALTDHNVVTNLESFIEQTKRINEHSIRLVGIPGIEISSNQGDILVYIPEEIHARALLKRFKKPSYRQNLSEIIEYYIEYYDAYFIFPHPECSYISSVTMNDVEKTLSHLNDDYKDRIGIEVFNWMSHIFVWERNQTESQLRQWVKELGLAAFGGTDYHTAEDVGNGYTLMYMDKLSIKSFISAFANKRTQPCENRLFTISDMYSVIKSSIRAEISTFLNPSFRVPKNSERSYTQVV